MTPIPDAPDHVVASFNNPSGDHCVDLFVRGDGTFGYEEYRRDTEDLRGWFSLRRFASQVFATEQAALARAKATVSWLAACETFPAARRASRLRNPDR